MTSTKKSARSKLKCKILWGQKSLGTKDTEEVKTDTTWAFQYSLETLGLVVINVKAGNKSLILDGYSEESGTKISESLLRRRYRYCIAFSIYFSRLFSLCPLKMSLKSPLLFYSEIYPVSEYFFYLRAMDQSKTYTPVSQTVIDIPTAIAFFGPDGCSDTLARVHTGVERLINEWNRRFCRNDVVRMIFVSYYLSILTTHTLCVVLCFAFLTALISFPELGTEISQCRLQRTFRLPQRA